MANSVVVLLTVVIFLIITISFFWKRRWFYYYASKIPSVSYGIPFIASLEVFGFLIRGRENLYEGLKKIAVNNPPICKVWLFNHIICFISEPEEIQLLFTKMLNKGFIHDFYPKDYFRNSMFVTTVETWKPRRKMLQHSFTDKIIPTFAPFFVKHSKNLVENLEQTSNQPIDIFAKILVATFDTTCETTADCDASILKDKERHFTEMLEFEDLIINRMYNPLYLTDFFWNFSWQKKKLDANLKNAQKFVHQILNKKNKDMTDDCQEKRFLNVFSKLSKTEVEIETTFMFTATSETTAICISNVLLALGLHPEIQEKVFEEQISIGGDCNFTIDDVNRMEYLNRVIQESMRLLPVVPLLIRVVDKDFPLQSCVLPKGTLTVIPLFYIHRHPDFWTDPLKFDPDRFLPEQSKNRPRGAYIPFSIGSRNCIGWKYGMLSMKIMISIFIRQYKITKIFDYETIEDVEFLSYYFVAKAKKGYRMQLEKRI